MKNILRNSAILFVLALGAVSCDDMLDRIPKDRLTPDTYFKGRAECELWTNNYYSVFPSAEGVYSENFDVVVRDVLPEEINGVRRPKGTDGNWNFDKLREMNTFLEHSHQCEDADVRLEYEALTRFFRAYFYFEKVKRFGDVPWTEATLATDDDELYKGRDPRATVMAKVMEDINFAVDNLPKNNTTQIYRVTRWTALALKSRIGLFEGTYRKYHGIEGHASFLEACVAASEEFFGGPYSIYNQGSTPYQTLFTSQQAVDTEIILARCYGSGPKLFHHVNGHLVGSTFGKPGMSREVVNTYLMKDGSRYTDKAGWQTDDFVTECANRDLRMAQTIRTPGYTRLGETAQLAPDLSCSTTGYQPIKYLTEKQYDSNNTSTNDMPLFRLAEVFLNYAEAKAELGTLTQADLDKSIKPIRSRAGLPALNMADANADPDPYLASSETGYANVTGDNKGVILEIRRERTLETLMEGLRYWDIMRWKEGDRFKRTVYGLYFNSTGEFDLDGNGTKDVCIYEGETAPSTSAPIVLKLNQDIYLSEGTSGYLVAHHGTTRQWTSPRDYLYPIPTEDRVVTQGAISQNPGWDDGLPF